MNDLLLTLAMKRFDMDKLTGTCKSVHPLSQYLVFNVIHIGPFVPLSYHAGSPGGLC